MLKPEEKYRKVNSPVSNLSLKKQHKNTYTYIQNYTNIGIKRENSCQKN
jgi:hypothetical protein